MDSLQLLDDLYYVGCVDHGLKVFDSIMPLEYGTSYNSYLLKTKEGCVLFEGNKADFAEEYLAHISSIADLKDISYLVVAHTEPDHSGAIEALLKKNPNIVVIASPSGINNLKSILRFPFKATPMTPGKEMKVGQYTLKFYSGLFLHWPDVLFTYIPELKTLVSCDAFGTHYAFDEILLSKVTNWEEYRASFDYYFDCIMAPFASYAIQAVDRVRGLEIERILPGHGPVVDCKVPEVLNAFEEDAKKNLPSLEPNKVTLVFTSCYRYTKQMAAYVIEELKKAGKEVSCFEIDALNYASLKPEILESIRSSSLVLFGTPTLVNDAVNLFYDLLISKTIPFFAGKKFAAFGDYGWSGEGVKNLSEFAATRKMKVSEGFRWSFKVDGECEKAMSDWVQNLLA